MNKQLKSARQFLKVQYDFEGDYRCIDCSTLIEYCFLLKRWYCPRCNKFMNFVAKYTNKFYKKQNIEF